jgi:hypothetical protein
MVVLLATAEVEPLAAAEVEPLELFDFEHPVKPAVRIRELARTAEINFFIVIPLYFTN